MSHLLDPITVRHTLIPNRLVFAPVATDACLEDGLVTEKFLQYYDERTKDGAIGLVIIEHSYIDVGGRARIGQSSISKDEDIPGWQSLTRMIHNNGSKVVIQLNHCGASMKIEESTKNWSVYSASSVLNKRQNRMPEPMNQSQIQDVVDSFVRTAIRAQQAGFDGIEIHSAHGYLLNQFYSPLTNLRSDEYGGSVENRIRFHLEVIRMIRAVVPEDFLVMMRLGACDYTEGGTTFEDSKIAAPLLCDAGLDILDLSGGLNLYLLPGHEKEQGYFVPMAEAIKSVVKTPIVVTGGFTDLKAADEVISLGKSDFIGAGRAILRDPHWAINQLELLKK